MKNICKLIIALVLVASMCLAFMACDMDDIIYNGETGADGETTDNGNVTEGSGENDDSSNADEGGENNGLQSPGANTEGGWSPLYPAA